MADTTLRTPYSSAALMLGANLPDWLAGVEAQRIATYQLYEDIYWNRPNTFKLVMRGTNDFPIYLPTARVICNTMTRYVARGFGWTPDTTLGTTSDQANLVAAFAALFKREKFVSKFDSNKLYGSIRGDACWYITANPLKTEGTRISINTISPGKVFWIEDETQANHVLGVDIIEELVDADNKPYIRRQRYLKSDHPDHPHYSTPPVPDGEISYELESLEKEKWDTEPKKQSGQEQIPQAIVAGITTLPVYHWKNFEEPDELWGSSEMRGIENLFSGINGTASDEDIALALNGLGLYWTDAGAPVDDDGNDVPWNLGPGQVVEIADGKKFGRVTGITSVDPFQKHIEMLADNAYRVSGASDVAQGRVDVQMAESGIALQLRMGPILDEAARKDTLITNTMDQFFYDLRTWFDVYEAESFGDATLVSTLGPKLPENQQQRFDMLMAGYAATPPIFSADYVRSELRRMGWEIPADIDTEILAEQEMAATAADPTGARLAAEAGAIDVPAGE